MEKPKHKPIGPEAANPRRGAWRRRFRSLIRFILVVGCMLALLVFLIDYQVEKQGRSQVVPLEDLAGQKPYDCVIVPGALVYPNGSPSAMLQDRLDMALKIFQGGFTDRILVSGDHGQNDYDEVGAMRNYLLAAGVPAEKVFMDHAGFDTYDTLYRAKAVFAVKRALITTQDFHLYRALYIGQQLGLDIQGVACAYARDYWSPRYRLREFPARVKSFLDCEVLKTKPTFSGPVIPISGDSRLTLD